MEKKYNMAKKFLRRDSARYLKFGKGRGKKAKWRAPKGRDNKMREKKRGYPAVVSIGYKKPLEKIQIIEISNPRDLKKLGKNKIGKIKSIGKKKKLEIAEEAVKLKVKLKNLNAEKYLKQNKKEKKEVKENEKEKTSEKIDPKAKGENKK
jgi:large subunit ribosomal protein L32e